MNREMALLLCGDFNDDPYSGIYQLLTKGYVQKNHRDWFAGVFLAFYVKFIFLNDQGLKQYFMK